MLNPIWLLSITKNGQEKSKARGKRQKKTKLKDCLKSDYK